MRKPPPAILPRSYPQFGPIEGGSVLPEVWFSRIFYVAYAWNLFQNVYTPIYDFGHNITSKIAYPARDIHLLNCTVFGDHGPVGQASPKSGFHRPVYSYDLRGFTS